MGANKRSLPTTKSAINTDNKIKIYVLSVSKCKSLKNT